MLLRAEGASHNVEVADPTDTAANAVSSCPSDYWEQNHAPGLVNMDGVAGDLCTLLNTTVK